MSPTSQQRNRKRFCLALALRGLTVVGMTALVLPAATGCDTSRRTREPTTQTVLPDDTGPQPEDGEAMAAILPKLKRGSEVQWGLATKLPAHFGVALMTRKGKTKVLSVTVDDLLEWPERVAILQALPDSIAGMPADIADGSWIRVLVAKRFEVEVRANTDGYRDPEKLRAWFDRLSLDELTKLAAPPPPELAP
jgi:hypothetical protein